MDRKIGWLTFKTEDGTQHYCPKHADWALANAEGLTYRKGAPLDAGCEACFGEKLTEENRAKYPPPEPT